MKRTLVIGSTCLDVVIHVPQMPVEGVDLNTSSHSCMLGGCAYNVSDVLRQSRLPYLLASPVGQGVYGKIVQQKLKEKNIPIFKLLNGFENGCCYCIVDNNSKHAFISCRGAEYLFDANWYSGINIKDFDSIYFCGMELEESTGIQLVSYLEEQKEKAAKINSPLTLYFDPGPHISYISKSMIERIYGLNPVIHLNRHEAKELTGQEDPQQAVTILHDHTQNDVVLTMDKDGAVVFNHQSGKVLTLPSFKTIVVDSVGAGDAHFGAFIASRKNGHTLEQSVLRANKYASAVVKVLGATIPDDIFKQILM
ncbi:MAG: PfkB family carbohydrate kinase [Treponema sp.]|nr:PfkB family carbohydrate kinase [Treponema sp.]